jgi:hypothetical protein
MKNTSLLTMAEYLNGMAARSWKSPMLSYWGQRSGPLQTRLSSRAGWKVLPRLPINSGGRWHDLTEERS